MGVYPGEEVGVGDEAPAEDGALLPRRLSCAPRPRLQPRHPAGAHTRNTWNDSLSRNTWGTENFSLLCRDAGNFRATTPQPNSGGGVWLFRPSNSHLTTSVGQKNNDKFATSGGGWKIGPTRTSDSFGGKQLRSDGTLDKFPRVNLHGNEQNNFGRTGVPLNFPPPPDKVPPLRVPRLIENAGGAPTRRECSGCRTQCGLRCSDVARVRQLRVGVSWVCWGGGSCQVSGRWFQN